MQSFLAGADADVVARLPYHLNSTVRADATTQYIGSVTLLNQSRHLDLSVNIVIMVKIVHLLSSRRRPLPAKRRIRWYVRGCSSSRRPVRHRHGAVGAGDRPPGGGGRDHAAVRRPTTVGG